MTTREKAIFRLTQDAASVGHVETLKAAPVWAAYERGEITRAQLFAALHEIQIAEGRAIDAVYRAAGR